MSIKQLYAKLPAVLVVVGLASATPPSAAAQAGVSLVPWVGAYIPTKNEISDIDNALTGTSASSAAPDSPSGEPASSDSRPPAGTPPPRSPTRPSTRRNTNLLRRQRPAAAGAEPGHQSGRLLHRRRSGAADSGPELFNEDREQTDFGGTAGLGFRFALGETGSSAVRLDLEDYFYNGDFGGGDEFQNDIVASLGLAIALGGKAGD